ncbi:hypothetical protein TSAR_009935 [Trichomalopsis sarcophagae]|uniref:Uncharacterized protein n=1 Tax=Trichomalopsis sarcophagae TaxID=543379 RepID=A0A232EHF6_9HYME|nr:hypothetical protein TSAR_009935 [Trichomalopsis sarcophagae]
MKNLNTNIEIVILSNAFAWDSLVLLLAARSQGKCIRSQYVHLFTCSMLHRNNISAPRVKRSYKERITAAKKQSYRDYVTREGAENIWGYPGKRITGKIRIPKAVNTIVSKSGSVTNDWKETSPNPWTMGLPGIPPLCLWKAPRAVYNKNLGFDYTYKMNQTNDSMSPFWQPVVLLERMSIDPRRKLLNTLGHDRPQARKRLWSQTDPTPPESAPSGKRRALGKDRQPTRGQAISAPNDGTGSL